MRETFDTNNEFFLESPKYVTWANDAQQYLLSELQGIMSEDGEHCEDVDAQFRINAALRGIDILLEHAIQPDTTPLQQGNPIADHLSELQDKRTAAISEQDGNGYDPIASQIADVQRIYFNA